MSTPVGQTPQFHQTWQALMRQLETILSIAHRHVPNATEAREAASVARHLLDKIADLILNIDPQE